MGYRRRYYHRGYIKTAPGTFRRWCYFLLCIAAILLTYLIFV